jgi:hypothetical protein
MGFLIKSAFWLGIVYSAMPLGAASVRDAASGVAREVCGPAGAALINRAEPAGGGDYRLAAASGCAALAASETAPPPELHAAAGPRPSAQTLTEDDRRPPWMGRDRRAAGEEPARDWRAAHPSANKHVAAAHRERHTADD